MLQGSLPAELGHVTDCIYICRRFVSSYAKIDIHIVFMVAEQFRSRHAALHCRILRSSIGGSAIIGAAEFLRIHIGAAEFQQHS